MIGIRPQRGRGREEDSDDELVYARRISVVSIPLQWISQLGEMGSKYLRELLLSKYEAVSSKCIGYLFFLKEPHNPLINLA